MKRKFLIAGLVVLTIVLGFIRDYIFVSLNRFIESGDDVGGRLLQLKWVLTALFSLLYFFDTCVFLFVLFRDKKYVWLSIFSFALLFVIAFLVALVGYCFSSFKELYPFIRTIMGVAQSPIVLMVLIAAGYLRVRLSNGSK